MHVHGVTHEKDNDAKEKKQNNIERGRRRGCETDLMRVQAKKVEKWCERVIWCAENKVKGVAWIYRKRNRKKKTAHKWNIIQFRNQIFHSHIPLFLRARFTQSTPLVSFTTSLLPRTNCLCGMATHYHMTSFPSPCQFIRCN